MFDAAGFYVEDATVVGAVHFIVENDGGLE